MGKYIKYSCCNLVCLLSIVCFLYGGVSLWTPLLLTLVLAVFGDTLLPQDSASHEYHAPWLLNFFLYMNLPLLLVSNLALLWQLAPFDMLGIGTWIDSTFALTIVAQKAATSGWHFLGGFLSLGLLFGIAGTNVAHELVHRTWSPFDLSIGRWLLAFTWDGEFAIEHVYGHHRKVATWEDPATSRRGEAFFSFFKRSLIGCNASAWHIEKEFLRKKNKPLWSHHNRLLRGWAISAGLALVSFALVGWIGLLLHFSLALYGKAYLELVNYIEHYGLTRTPNSPVQLHHSWNSNAPISSWFLFNLPRHSHHHATGHLPFWKLKPQADAPRLPFGYMSMILIALVPPLFKKVMAPALANWDAQYAKPTATFRVSR